MINLPLNHLVKLCKLYHYKLQKFNFSWKILKDNQNPIQNINSRMVTKLKTTQRNRFLLLYDEVGKLIWPPNRENDLIYNFISAIENNPNHNRLANYRECQVFSIPKYSIIYAVDAIAIRANNTNTVCCHSLTLGNPLRI